MYDKKALIHLDLSVILYLNGKNKIKYHLNTHTHDVW